VSSAVAHHLLVQRVLDPIKPARNERVDDRNGVSGFGQRRRPVQVEHAGRFDQDQKASACREMAPEPREEFAPSGCVLE
jgi:hypothetical protein